MSKYFWAANGDFTSNIIENLSLEENKFNVGENKICIQDTCITKNEISQLKQLLPGYNIIERSPNLEMLTDYEIKLFLKEVFKKMHLASTYDEKNKIYGDFFINGLYDIRSGDSLSFIDFYINTNTDFNDLFLNIDSVNIFTKILNYEETATIIETDNLKERDDLIFSLSSTKIQNVGSRVYALMYNNYTILLVKLSILNESKWKILIYTTNILNSMFIKQNEIFNEKFKTNFDIINYFNSQNITVLTEYRYYIDNIRAISIIDGKFNLDIFKNNIFASYYKGEINLSDLTDDEIMKKIYDPLKFEYKDITLIDQEKEYLGYYELHNKYILMEDSNYLELRLIYGKKNSTDTYKWVLVYIKK